MPQTQAVSTPALGIQLERPKHAAFRPGDTIVGRVHRTASGVAPEARLIVTLHGRTKVKLKQRRGNAEYVYRSSFDCLSAPVNNQLLLSGAPLHIPEGSEGASWPFTLTIPPIVTDVRQAGERKYYVSPGGADGASFPPPGTFDYSASEMMLKRARCSAFIEYYVQAQIELVHQHKGRTKRDVQIATAPFPLANVHPGPPVTDFALRPYRTHQSIVAYRLAPGMEELSIGQKTKQLFSSAKVPKLTFDLTLHLPHVLQVENTNLIPLTLVFEAIPSATSDSIYNIQQQLAITSFSMRVKPRTSVQAQRHDFNNSSSDVKLIESNAIAALGRDASVTLTPGTKAGPEAQTAYLNLGEILDFRFTRGGLHPNIAAYNIVRVHELIWEVEGNVVGEKFKAKGSHPVVVLPGPSESGVQSRGEVLPGYSKKGDAPPGYNPGQKG
ncbi:hypothetical protein BJY04DRAFT_187962 [Aspergillus karnatakaensis]|uniref:uncharacterized protein n=1 Tax=Aspergillus karnatakaensis TaxID=1810916 RepID=UPI003CCD9A33